MSVSSITTGVCKAIRITLVNSLEDKNYVCLYLRNVEHNHIFKLRFYINLDKDSPESIIDEIKKDAFITISNPVECAKLLAIFHTKQPKETDYKLKDLKT